MLWFVLNYQGNDAWRHADNVDYIFAAVLIVREMLPKHFIHCEGENMGIRGEMFTSRYNTERRTYFFNVKQNRNGDVFLNVVESVKEGFNQFDRHSIIIYEEDIEKFYEEFKKAYTVIKEKK